jgi:RNA polymerase sigma-70 factor, ECF subfamily
MRQSALPAPTADDPATDLEILHAVLAGERERFATLVTRYNQRLYRVGWAYLRDHGQIEDAMQNAYLKAYASLKKFRGQAGFGTWLTRIMINECLMVLRQARARREDALETATIERIWIADTKPQDSRINLDEMKALLEKAIAALPAAYRAVFLLREVQQLSTAETAACLGITSVSAKVKLHRARAMIKDRLLENAATEELFAYNAPFCNALTQRVMLEIARQPA